MMSRQLLAQVAAARGTAAIIDRSAIRHNVIKLRSLAPASAMMAVVKADGYGHGATEVALAALGAGADWLGVALVAEALGLRDAGIDAPILVLSEPPLTSIDAAARYRVDVTVASPATVAALEGRSNDAPVVRVHLKVDTGMSRMGTDPAAAVGLVRRLHRAEQVELVGVFTHLACADADDLSSANAQLDTFDRVLDELRAADLVPPLVHAANSAGTVFVPRSHHGMVRCGIALYGLDPNPARADRTFDRLGLRPALGLASYVSAVREVAAGQGVSYGHRFVAAATTTLATVPIGYADGVPRGLGAEGTEVLIGGVRRPIRGVVTMDQLMADCTATATSASDHEPVRVGDSVVLLGEQGDEAITASDWAVTMNTINYEVVCGISARVPRLYVDTEEPTPGARTGLGG